MKSQLDLFSGPQRISQAAFDRYCEAHPEVEECFLTLARQVRDRGFSHFGANAIWERMRWYFRFEKGDDDLKLNNNYTSRYARKIMAEHPEFAGFFNCRELRS